MINGAPRTIEVEEIDWAHPSELSGYPMGKIDRMISEAILKQ
jgi:hypothetical protein